MDISHLVARTAAALLARGWTLATAESCTGGLISSTLTDTPGASAWFLGGVVAYANSAKVQVLGVPQPTLDQHGAVSEATVLAMAQGARQALGAQAAIAVSGVAGPTGGTPDKPVGTVWMAWSLDGAASARRFSFTGDRAAIKVQTLRACLEGLANRLESLL
jgi:nicotinamide-nucleotide amidase